MKHLLFFLLLAAATNAQAQCDQFDNLLKKGDNFLKGKKPNYQEAINAYTAAILACSDRAGEAQKRLAKMVSDINQLRKNAVAEKKRAEAVLDKIYFYAGELGLAYDKVSQKYGYIDKNLNTKIAFKYDEAFSFDFSGYAKVKRKEKEDDEKGIYFLIDTRGNEYKLATEVNQLDSTITALDLRSKGLTTLPDVVYQHKQLQILLIDKILSDSIIKALHNLKSLISSEGRYAIITLYFDDDKPDASTPKTIEKQDYRRTYIDFYRRKPEFLEKCSEGLSGIEMQEALDSMDVFFDRDVRGGWENLFRFAEEIYLFMERGDFIILTLRGFTAPVRNSQYNMNLAERRILSVLDFFLIFDGGIYKQYVDNGQLVIKIEPIGENRAPNDVSDNISDERNSIYSLKAMRENRLEIKRTQIKIVNRQ